MRCTKCHYLSFEPEARCRNCGHDLSIDDLAAPDLPLTLPHPDDDPVQEFDLAEASIAGLGAATAVMSPPVRTAPAVALAPAPIRVSATVTSELPLFVREMVEDPDGEDPEREDDDDEEHERNHQPLVRVPARPRAPIAVRRTTPDPARLRAKYSAPATADRDFRDLLDDPTEEPLAPSRLQATADMDVESVPPRLPAAWRAPVAAGTRLTAAAIDASLLGAIAAVVTAFTLRFAGVPLGSFGVLSAVPLAAFVLLIAAGYELMFTAAHGQTIGKMVMGIRVVGADAGDDRVTISQAAVRALTAVPSVLALGLGFLPALLGAGVTVHDRVAHTRVVRV